MTKRKRHYLLPDNLEPDEDFCARVYIPNEPAYRRAFLGAYTAFSQWWVWERDNNKSGATAAKRWMSSVDKTLELWGTGCAECDEMTRDDVIKIISEELDMNINITQNCGCGCSGGGGSNPGVLPESIPIETSPPVHEVEPGDLPTDRVTADQCAKAQYVLMQWRNTVLSIENGDYTTERYANWVYGVFSGGWDWVVDKATVVAETLGLFDAVSSGTSDAIDSVFTEMKCEILQGGSQSELSSRLNGKIESMGLGFVKTYQLKKLLYYMPLTAPFDSSFENVSQEYYAAGCPDCVDEKPLPVPSGAFFRDHTSTQGYFALDGTNVGPVAIDFFREYNLGGDYAGHMDCMISSTLGSNTPLAMTVDLYNQNLASLTVNCVDVDGVGFNVVVPPGETVRAFTSRLDGNFPDRDHWITVTCLSVDDLTG